SKQFRIPQMISDERNDVLISIQTHRLRIHRRKPPVLTSSKYTVGRRSAGDAFHEKISVSPRVITFGVKAEGKIQIEKLAAGLCALRKHLDLLLNNPLRVEVIVFCGLVVISSLDCAVAKPRRPGAPSSVLPVHHGAESRVVFHAFVFANEFSERLHLHCWSIREKCT